MHEFTFHELEDIGLKKLWDKVEYTFGDEEMISKFAKELWNECKKYDEDEKTEMLSYQFINQIFDDFIEENFLQETEWEILESMEQDRLDDEERDDRMAGTFHR